MHDRGGGGLKNVQICVTSFVNAPNLKPKLEQQFRVFAYKNNSTQTNTHLSLSLSLASIIYFFLSFFLTSSQFHHSSENTTDKEFPNVLTFYCELSLVQVKYFTLNIELRGNMFLT